MMRQSQIIDEKAAGNSRHNDIGKDLRHRTHQTGKNTQIPAAVAHFQHLSVAQRFGFPVAVNDKSGQAQRNAQRQFKTVPETQSKAVPVVHLNSSDDTHDGQCFGDITDTDDITSAQPPGGEKIGDLNHIAFTISMPMWPQQGA